MSSSENGSEPAEAVKGRALQDVEADVARTIEGLQALKAERDSLPALVEEAAANFDSARLAELAGRGRDLEAQIEAGQARLFRLYAERARLQLPAAERKAEEAKAEYERAHAAYLEAHERVNRLGVESNNASVRVVTLKQAAEENERRAREISRRTPAGQS